MTRTNVFVAAAAAVVVLACLAGPAMAQTTAPASGGTEIGAVPSLKTQLGTITGVVALTLVLTQVAKVYLAAVPALGRVPIWMYASAIATALTLLARFALGSLAGDWLDLLWQANVAAIMAVGGFSVLKQPLATPASSAAGGTAQKSGGGQTWAGVALVIGCTGLLLGGCATNPSEAVKGASGTLAIYDANSSKPAIEYITGGASVAAAKVRLADSPKTGRVLTIGSVASEDTVAEQQGQLGIKQQDSYLLGVQSVLALVAALKNGGELTLPASSGQQWQANTNHGVPALPGAQPAVGGSDLARMLVNCQSRDEQEIVLRAAGLSKTSTPAATSSAAKAKKPKKATTQPATRPAGTK